MQEFLLSSPDTLFSWFLERGPSVFSLGIVPYVAASVVVLLLSGVVPSLRGLRDGPAEANAAFDRLIYGVTTLLALVQGWALATFLRVGTTPSGQPLVAAPDAMFRVQTLAIVVTGSILLVWLAAQVTRQGLVNGVVLIVFVDLIADATAGGAALGGEGVRASQAAFLVGAVAGVAALCVYMVRAGRRIPLRLAEGGLSATWVPSIVLRPNTVGAVPVGIAGVAMLPVAHLGVTPGSTLSWIVQAGLIAFFTYLWTAVTFSGAAVVGQIRRFGLELADVDSTRTPEDHLDGIVERFAAQHAVFLVALVVVAPFALERVGIGSGVSWLVGPWLLVAAAIGAAIVDRLQGLKRGMDWVPVFEGETELEVDLVRSLLERAGIPTRRASTRVIPVTGTLAFWEMNRPPYPSWTIHRRLGAGGVYAEVPAEQVRKAEHVVRRHR